MPNAKPRRRPPLTKSLPYFLPALVCVALAALAVHPLVLIPLLAANTLALAAVCHAIGFEPEPDFRSTVLRRGAAHLVLFTAYVALVLLLVAWPLVTLTRAPSLAGTLLLSTALVVALAALWRLWPAFGLLVLWDDAFPEPGERSWIFTAIARSVAFARHLATDQEHRFFTHFLPTAIALLVLAFGALALTGLYGVLPQELRTAALLLYGLAVLPLGGLVIADRTLRALLCDRRRARHGGGAKAHAGTPGAAPPVRLSPAETLPGAREAALLEAARNGQTERALALLEAGADANAEPEPGARDRRPLLVLAALLPDTRLLRALIARGADVNRARDGLTALLAATRDSYHGRAEAVMTLLANGADPAAADVEGNTPLHGAALSADAGVAAMLLDAGAPLDALNRAGLSPLAVACRAANWPLVRFLLERGAKPEPARGEPALLAAASIAEDDPTGLRLLLKHRARVDAANALGRTALMHAALEGHRECVRVLLAAGADPARADQHGTTALMEAARAGAAGVIAALAEAKASPAPRDAHGRDALALA
ncbi:ankyrin repeat domain-containing protein, partial [Mizugakiibacter sediminis]|uniref:ankyrin repeat domain-containing protein n=1 Tax=Mizugakiibacter sediminis TaxID=1475481 RepID=UPI0016517085